MDLGWRAHGAHRMEDTGQRTRDGRTRMEHTGWTTQDGGHRMEEPGWSTQDPGDDGCRAWTEDKTAQMEYSRNKETEHGGWMVNNLH